MGNCQAVDAAALVIQHPCGKLDRMYWPITASEVMKTNPGHYVSLIIPLQTDDGDISSESDAAGGNINRSSVRFTRVKLLRPTDTLVLGRAYRLVTTQEVMKVVRAKENAKMKKTRQPSQTGHTHRHRASSDSAGEGKPDEPPDVNDQAIVRSERHGQRSGPSMNSGSGRPKTWRPSLQSISEASS